MTWTVDSADVATYSFYLKDRILTINFALNLTTTGGVPNPIIRIAIPNSYVIQGSVLNAGVYIDTLSTGVAAGVGYLLTLTGGVVINIARLLSGNFPLVTNTLSVSGAVSFDIQ